MEIVAEDARSFKQAIDAIVNLVDEGSFEISPEGVRLRTMDPSQIAMVDFHLPKDAFSKIEVADAAAFGVNLVDFSKILARARSDEKLTLSLDEKENKFVLEFMGKSKRHFRMPLIDLNAATPREPKIPFDAAIKIRGGNFKEMLKDAGLISSHVIIQAQDSEFVVEAHGDSGDLKIETKKDSESIAEMSAKSKSRAMFPFEYLDDITRACPDDEPITVELKNDAPIKLSYAVGKAKLAYFLAPRVEQA